jgi:hypothetical protein
MHANVYTYCVEIEPAMFMQRREYGPGQIGLQKNVNRNRERAKYIYLYLTYITK